ILTDSGGFQIFSLSSLRKISEDGVLFRSHIDGREIFIGPEESMQIQINLGSTIAMAFDECVKLPADREYIKLSCERTARWLYRCKKKFKELLKEKEKTQLLFAINQGGICHDLRSENMKMINELNIDGYAIGGLAVGETYEEMYEVLERILPMVPRDKPRYLMGVGTPANILESVRRGIDLFDCVMPSRNARHGSIFTSEGILNILSSKYEKDPEPLDKNCDCHVCKNHSKAYIRHLFKSKEVLALRLSVMHNLYFYNTFMENIRKSLEENCFEEFFKKNIEKLSQKI
ncbi:MAG: tRNA guanosine(34) transglycosylase Tgt, partial [Firmicutes bacterium]|nr:tRNA guanosine(34) transglycosylase Tgt [Bacillota bacterium]